MSDAAQPRATVRHLMELHVVRSDGPTLRTTRRFQAAMARAAARLVRGQAEGFDLRIPVAAALLELHAVRVGAGAAPLTDEQLATLVELMLPIEARELAGLPLPLPGVGG